MKSKLVLTYSRFGFGPEGSATELYDSFPLNVAKSSFCPFTFFDILCLRYLFLRFLCFGFHSLSPGFYSHNSDSLVLT